MLNFVSVIQLVTALNFANISSSLHEKMFRNLVNVKSFFNFRFGDLQNKMTADVESLKSMSPIETKDGKSNKSIIDELTNEYLNLSTQWETERKRVEAKMGDFFNTKGINSLFLFISLYCVIDMFFIAYECFHSIDMSQEYWFGCYTILSTIITIVYFCLILSGKTKLISRGSLYLLVSGMFLVCLLTTYMAHWLNSITVDCFFIFEEFDFLCLSDTYAVFLPFMGFVLCLIFIMCIWLQVNGMIRNSISLLSTQLSKLHERKLTLDRTYETFKPVDQMQFG